MKDTTLELKTWSKKFKVIISCTVIGLYLLNLYLKRKGINFTPGRDDKYNVYKELIKGVIADETNR